MDVRLRPDRASLGVYVRAKSPDKGIQRLFASAGLGYRSLPELGNLFLDFEDWRERYAAFIQCAGHLLTSRLDELEPPLCLLCAKRSSTLGAMRSSISTGTDPSAPTAPISMMDQDLPNLVTAPPHPAYRVLRAAACLTKSLCQPPSMNPWRAPPA